MSPCPALTTPRCSTSIEEPASFTPSTISEFLNSIQDDIRRREASWGRLVNAGEREWAQHENAAERAEEAAKLMAAEAKATAAVHSAYITRAASTFQGVLMQNQVKQVVTERLGSSYALQWQLLPQAGSSYAQLSYYLLDVPRSVQDQCH